MHLFSFPPLPSPVSLAKCLLITVVYVTECELHPLGLFQKGLWRGDLADRKGKGYPLPFLRQGQLHMLGGKLPLTSSVLGGQPEADPSTSVSHVATRGDTQEEVTVERRVST